MGFASLFSVDALLFECDSSSSSDSDVDNLVGERSGTPFFTPPVLPGLSPSPSILDTVDSPILSTDGIDGSPKLSTAFSSLLSFESVGVFDDITVFFCDSG